MRVIDYKTPITREPLIFFPFSHRTYLILLIFFLDVFLVYHLLFPGLK
jgi:hypothetical protein